jgi:hypothetical protein
MRRRIVVFDLLVVCQGRKSKGIDTILPLGKVYIHFLVELHMNQDCDCAIAWQVDPVSFLHLCISDKDAGVCTSIEFLLRRSMVVYVGFVSEPLHK